MTKEDFKAKTNDAAIENADKLLATPKDYVLAAKSDYWNGAYEGFLAGVSWAYDMFNSQLDEILKALRN